MSAPEYLTTAQLAELLHSPPSTVRYWRYRGVGPPGIKVGRRVLYRRRDVDQWIEECEHGRPLLITPPSQAVVTSRRRERPKAG